MFNKKISYRQAIKRIELLEEQVKDLTFLTENQAERIKELKEDINNLVENNDTWSEVLPNPDDKEAWNDYWNRKMSVQLIKKSDIEGTEV